MTQKPGRRTSSRPPMPIPRGWRIPAEQLCADVEDHQFPALDDEAALTGGGRGRLLAWSLFAVVLVVGLGWLLFGASRTSDETEAVPVGGTAPAARGDSENPGRDDNLAPRAPSPAAVEVDGGQQDSATLLP